MNRIQLLLLFLLSTSFGFSQEEEKSGHLSLKIKNELGEVFKESILLIANKDTIPIIASWDNSFRTDLLPGNYRLIIQNKLFNDCLIPSIWIKADKTQEIDIVWPHRILRFPGIRFPICVKS